MRTIRLIAVCAVFAAFFAVSAMAQTTAATGDKIGLIAWGAFEDPTKGIKKYSAALTALNKEFEPARTELQNMYNSYQTKKNELQKMQEDMQAKKVPVSETTLQTKAEELGKMERDIKFKKEDYDARVQSRFGVVIGPIQNDIQKALNEYAAQKGYALILDGAKLNEAGVLLGFNQKANVTEDFIVFYNARPATTATK
jgi:Skp family chaperone for outer membrane proteins